MTPERRRTGRPPLDPHDPAVEFSLRLPSKRYDALYRQAREAHVSVAELVRRLLNVKVPEGDPKP
jgi:predicted HicB family RNase H-like nuclease